MKLKIEPLTISATIGALIWIVGGIVTLIFGYRMMETMLTSPIFDPAYLETIDPNTTDPLTAVFGESFRDMFALSTIANLLQCFTWLVSGAAAGALYVILYRRQEPLAAGGEAGVGAATGALAVILGYLVTSIISVIVIVPLWNDFMGQFLLIDGVNTPDARAALDQMASMMVIFVAVGAICGIILYGAIGAVMGAIGGILGNALAKPSA